MKRYLKKGHRYFYLGSVAVFFFLMYPFIYYNSRSPGRYHRMNRFRKLLAVLSSSCSGIFYRFSFEEAIDWTKPYIICANHTSNLDITAISLLPRSNYAFLGKAELADKLVTSVFFRTIDIPVRRESKVASFRAFKKGEDYLKKGISLAIFPEGTIADSYPPRLQSFKNGPFRLAIQQQVPVIPVTLVDVWKKMWDDGSMLGSSPGICNIRVHKPVETIGLTLENLEDLREHVHYIINQELQKYEA